jgi:hypothetical protein
MSKNVKLRITFNNYSKIMYSKYVESCENKNLGDAWTYNAYFLKMKEHLKKGYKNLVKDALKEKLI